VSRETSFAYSFLALDAERRAAIVALWDFCRAADDAVDLGGPEPARALAAWRREVDACFGTGTPATAVGRRLQEAIRRFDLSRPPFDNLLDGVAMDLRRVRYETFEDLRGYCLRVASAVGLLCVEIFGCRSDAARAYAIELGIALQLTNILRDVAQDLARGRLYVPLEDLRAFRCSEALLAEAAARADGRLRPEVRALLAHQAARARRHHDRARALLPRADARRLVAAEIMRATYAALLDRIERAGYDVFSRPVGLPRALRARVALATWLKTMVRA